MANVGVCGILCDECSLFQRECGGCMKEMRSHSSYTCEVYSCALEKGISSCEECTEDMNYCLKSKEHRSFCPLLVSKTHKFEVRL